MHQIKYAQVHVFRSVIGDSPLINKTLRIEVVVALCVKSYESFYKSVGGKTRKIFRR